MSEDRRRLFIGIWWIDVYEINMFVFFLKHLHAKLTNDIQFSVRWNGHGNSAAFVVGTDPIWNLSYVFEHVNIPSWICS